MTAWCDHDNYVDESEFCNPVVTRYCTDCGATKVLEPEPHEHDWRRVAEGPTELHESCDCGASRQTHANGGDPIPVIPTIRLPFRKRPV